MKDEKVFSRSHGPAWERAEAMPAIAVGISVIRYQRIANRKNNIDIMFFRCAIQATDSTFTGCKAKIMAAKNAPGMDNFLKISQISKDSMMCKIELVTW